MRVLLIQPPVQDFYDTDVRLQPIGLCYLKAAVNTHLPDIDIIVKDYHGGAGRKTVAIPKELRYLTEYYGVADKSPFSTFHRYYHFGKSFEAIEEEIALLKPDVVGISSLFTPYFREALEVAARVKKRFQCHRCHGRLPRLGGAGIAAGIGPCRLRHSRRGRKAVCRIPPLSNESHARRDRCQSGLQTARRVRRQSDRGKLSHRRAADAGSERLHTGELHARRQAADLHDHVAQLSAQLFVLLGAHDLRHRLSGAARWTMFSAKSNCATGKATVSSISRTTISLTTSKLSKNCAAV